MAKIAVDIDSTLYDFSTLCREAFIRLAHERDDRSLLRGAYAAWTEWRSPTDACGVQPFLDVLDYCHDNDTILAQTPFSGAVETCQALAAEGHDLLYISNRRVESTAATEEWLKQWKFPLSEDEHELLCLMDEKRDHIAECQYIIDDRPRTVVDFIYDYEWETRLRSEAKRIASLGPNEDEPYYDEAMGAMSEALDLFYAEQDNTEAFEKYRELCELAAEKYVSNTCRRAFVLAYPYNQNLTDIPHLYLAPTWAGLNDYLVGKGVLSKPAILV